MGFIFAGCGFKRRCPGIPGARSGVAVPGAGRPANPGAKPVSSREHVSSSPSSSSDVLAIPPNAGKRAKFSQNGTAHVLLPPSNSVVPPTFVDLPPEVLIRIYCFAGLGKANQLSSTGRYLHDLFDFTKNVYFLEMLVARNALLDLSAGLGSRSWHEKFMKKYDALPEAFRDLDVLDNAFQNPVSAAITAQAIDCSIFTHPHISGRHVRFLKSRFGGICVDLLSAESEGRYKRRYLEWKYMVFKKYVSLATEAINEIVDTSAKQLYAKAQESESCLLFKKTHGLENYTPLVESVDIPWQMYRHVTPNRLDVISELGKQYGMKIRRPALLVSAVFATNLDLSDDLLDCVFHLSSEKTATASDVAEALRTFSECRNRLFSLPLEARETHPMSGALSRYFDFLKDILAVYYGGHVTNDSSVIWELLREIEIPELLDHVVGLGVSIPSHIF